jgi:hypothetical protein
MSVRAKKPRMNTDGHGLVPAIYGRIIHQLSASARLQARRRFHPLPGVRADVVLEKVRVVRIELDARPHPNPLPRGEGTASNGFGKIAHAHCIPRVARIQINAGWKCSSNASNH